MNVLSGAALPSSVVSSIPRHGFEATRVLVVGDLMLDRYILGDVNRLSPEAPVPVLAIKGQRATAGGAANVALNVAGLNARALLAGVVGEDTPGHQLMNILTERRIDV